MTNIALPINELPDARQSGYLVDYAFGSPRLINPDGNIMEVTVHEREDRAIVCTIFFNGLPVVVIPPNGDYRYNFVEYVEPAEVKHFVTFMAEVIGEFGVTGKTNRDASRIIRNAVDAGMVRSYWDEYGGRGSRISAFINVVIRELQRIFPHSAIDPKQG